MDKSAKGKQNVSYGSTSDIIMGISSSTIEPPTMRPDGMQKWMIHLTLIGLGRVNRGENRFECGPGTLTLFPPRVTHDYAPAEKDGDWEHVWVYFQPKPQWYALLEWPDRGAGVRGFRPQTNSVGSKITAAFKAAYRRLRSTDTMCHELSSNYLEQALLWCMFDLRSAGTSALFDSRISLTVDYIHRNYAESISVSQLADKANLSSSRFSHLFAESTGMPVSRYIARVRLERARELLIGSMRRVTEIAFACGFSDSLYFSRAFRKAYGISPREYRAKGEVIS